MTQLPAPNYHCRGGEPTAVREMPAAGWGHVTVDLKRQVGLLLACIGIACMRGPVASAEAPHALAHELFQWIPSLEQPFLPEWPL